MTIALAVVPVAGLGTRLLPMTKSQPKEMLPVAGRPAVQHVVEELVAAGIERIVFVTGRSKRAIEDHFEEDESAHFLYTRQPRPLGLGDAVLRAEPAVGGEPFVVALGDTIIGPASMRALVAAFAGGSAAAAIAVEEVAAEAVSRYGIVDAAEDGTVRTVVEKPALEDAPSRLAIAARYAFTPAIFGALREIEPAADGELQLSDAIGRLAASGKRVVAVPLAGGERRYDIGSLESYAETALELALRDPVLGTRLRERARTVLDAHGPG